MGCAAFIKDVKKTSAACAPHAFRTLQKSVRAPHAVRDSRCFPSGWKNKGMGIYSWLAEECCAPHGSRRTWESAPGAAV